MWTVTKIGADCEGWQLFNDWPENIVKRYQYQDFDDMFKYYQQLINQYKAQFDNYVTGKYSIYAFYSSCDMNYCEDCEGDLQIFYGFIVLQDNEVHHKLPITN